MKIQQWIQIWRPETVLLLLISGQTLAILTLLLCFFFCAMLVTLTLKGLRGGGGVILTLPSDFF